MNTPGHAANAYRDPLSETLKQMGGVTQQFKPEALRMVVGMVLGVLFGLGGLAVLILDIQADIPMDRKLLGVALALILLVVGGFAIIYVRYSSAHRVFVCPEGLVISNRGKMDVCRWDEVGVVIEVLKKDFFPLDLPVGQGIPLGRSVSYQVIRKDGVDFCFDRDNTAKLANLIDMILQMTTPRQVPFKREYIG